MSAFYREDPRPLLDQCIVASGETNTDSAESPSPAHSRVVRRHQESDVLGCPGAFAPVLLLYFRHLWVSLYVANSQHGDHEPGTLPVDRLDEADQEWPSPCGTGCGSSGFR